MILNSARQHDILDIATQRDEIIRCMRMIDALHGLFDDRSFVEIGGDIMRRGADDLDAALVRLVIRLGAFEARQEGMEDVDSTP